MWITLGVIAVVLLIVYFSKGRNSVWGGLSIGVFVGIIITIIYAIMGKGFMWGIIVKSIIVGIFVGFIADILGIISDKLKKT
jgi:hypothetical protein